MGKKKQKKLEELLRDIDEITFVNLREKYAKKQSKIAMANGFTALTKDESAQKDIDRFNDTNEMNELLVSILYHSKLQGRIIVSPTILSNGEFRFSIAYPFNENRISQITTEAVQAVVYQRPKKDDTTWLIKEVWDKDKVIRLWVNTDEKANTLGESIRVEPPYKLNSVEYHNLGYLPVFEYKNFNIEQFLYGPETLSTNKRLAFDVDCFNLENLYNLTLQVAFVEAISTQTHLSFNLDPGTLARLQYNSSGLKRLLLTKISISSKKVGDKIKAPVMEMIQGTFQAENYMKFAIALEKLYAEGVGSSFQAEGQGMATATEIVYTNSDDDKTANQDMLKLNKILTKMIAAHLGLNTIEDDIPFITHIIGNKVMNDKDLLETSLIKFNNGIITKVQLIQLVEKMDEEEATLQKEATDKEQEAEQKAFMLLTGQPAQDPLIPQDPNKEDPTKQKQEEE